MNHRLIPTNPERPPSYGTAMATADPALGAGTHVTDVEKQETALTGNQAGPDAVNLKTDGGARPKVLGNPIDTGQGPTPI